jgi:hypothetical protein
MGEEQTAAVGVTYGEGRDNDFRNGVGGRVATFCFVEPDNDHAIVQVSR